MQFVWINPKIQFCSVAPTPFVIVVRSDGFARDFAAPFVDRHLLRQKQAATTQWDLSVTAVPVDQIRKDIHSLEQKIYQFWISARAGKQNDTELASILADNYVQRPKTVQSNVTDEADGFIVVQELAGIVV